MNQLTVRGFDDELSERIRRLAKRDGTSLNQAALKLLRKGAGLADPAQKADTIGSALDHLIGSWSDDEAAELDAVLQEFEVIDEGAWQMRVLLDSNAYSRLMRGDEQTAAVVRDATEILMSAVVIGELLYGFRNGFRFDRNAADLRSFLDNPYVSFVPVGSISADRYSRIAAALRAKGNPIPTNDVWIAAHAMETGADLVSADRHFEAVDGIA